VLYKKPHEKRHSKREKAIYPTVLNSPRLVLCKKPHEKRHRRREKAIYPTVSKMAVFGKTAKGGP